MPLAPDKTPSPKSRALFVGLATVDAEYFLDDLPGPNQKLAAQSQYIAAGGPAANAAITFAFLGGYVSLVTAVGRHPLAEVIHNDLRHFGVALSDIAKKHEEAPPLSSIFVLKNGERSIVSVNAAAFSSLQWEIDSKLLENTSIVLVDGHYMSLCQAVASSARSRGIRVVLDAGSWKHGMDELLSNVDIAICSDDFRPPACMSEADVFSYLATHGIKFTAITHSGKPISYMENGTRAEIAVEQVNVTDTLGAGDVFHGAFCFRASQPGNGFQDSLQFAAHTASFSCQYPGTRLWMQEFSAS